MSPSERLKEIEKEFLTHEGLTRTCDRDVLWLINRVKRLTMEMEQIAQWDGDKVSIIPSKALIHYAKQARKALEDK